MKNKYLAVISIIMLFLPLAIIGLSDMTLNPHIKTSDLKVVKTAHADTSNSDTLISGITVSPQTVKEYTIMLFINGSDLESEYAAATADLLEMASSNFNKDNINVIVFAGGSKHWHTKGIPNNLNTIYKLDDYELVKLAEAGQETMGEPKLLSEYINFATSHFPAEKYGLILWNHGGGAVVGYGADERYEQNPEMAALKLTDIDKALTETDMNKKLEFLGFDTCLMSTIEMANISKKHSKYLIASEEVEPEQGWDYTFLGALEEGMEGADIGKLIIDYYGSFYNDLELEDFATLSMTNLSKIENVVDAFEDLSQSAGLALNAGHYNQLSKARSRTRSFGSGGEDGDTDMVDIREMCTRLQHLFPNEVNYLLQCLDDAVEYKYENWDETIGGLSVYFPFYNKEDLEYNIETYKEMKQLPAYTGFISSFSEILGDASSKSRGRNIIRSNTSLIDQVENITDVRMTAWKEYADGYYIQIGDENAVINNDGTISYESGLVTLNGYAACMYDTNNSAIKRFTIPVKLNGEDANLIASYSDKFPDGKIIGAIPTNNNAFDSRDKKLIKIKDGDMLSLRYYAVTFGGEGETTDVKETERWVDGEAFTVYGELVLEKTVDDNYLRKLNIIDTKNNNNYIDVVSVS